jgi:hypothetical protein
VTGLTKGNDGVSRNWYDAAQYCEDLVLGGHDDWRLPRIDELKTIEGLPEKDMNDQYATPVIVLPAAHFQRALVREAR